MNAEQAREIFNQALVGKSPDGVARIEIVREYFTNPEFRSALEQMVWEINNGGLKP